MRRTVALLLATATALAGCGLPEGTVGPNDWDLHAISHDGRTLVVSTFFGGVASDCTRFERWEIGESDDEVEVRAMLWRRRGASSCTDEGVTEELTLRLDAPLGDRRLAGCGHDECDRAGGDDWFATADVDADAGIVAVQSGNELVLLDPVSGEITGRARGFHSDVMAVGGTVLAAVDEGRTVAYEVPDAGPAATPERRWTVRTRPLAITDDRLITCDGDAPAQQVSARDVTTGERLWSLDVACPERPTVDGELLAGTARLEDGAPHLVVIDLADGAVVTDVAHRIGDGGVAVVGGRLVSLSGGGSTSWDLSGEELARGNATGHRMLGAANGLAIGASLTEPWLVVVDPENANLVWRRHLDAEAERAVSIDDGAVFVADVRDGEVHRLDLATGDPLWTADVGTTRAAGVTVHGDTAYVATITSLLALDLGTGQERWATTHLEPDTPTEASDPS
ncbi:MAG TPA: PQQ-binding-like beta-propeller repeat protein [Egicoccus sp.]|nr:PQQ-binding-like beta-propeller repeat protein [Egicoccus sp.]HSK24959.1 PQQ-binding-like beta-propeller repeat protein [Egicoccus sp.]